MTPIWFWTFRNRQFPFIFPRATDLYTMPIKYTFKNRNHKNTQRKYLKRQININKLIILEISFSCMYAWTLGISREKYMAKKKKIINVMIKGRQKIYGADFCVISLLFFKPHPSFLWRNKGYHTFCSPYDTPLQINLFI